VSNPQRIQINPSRLTVAETEQRYCRVREENKLEALMRFIEAEEVKSALIFARTKARTQELADTLIERGFPAEALHGDLSQARREQVLNRFRQKSITLLVATDVAARGLDIENVSHVFNFDVPGDPEDYVHRIGRTGRAGRKGIAITFLHPRDRVRLREIEAYTHQPMVECRVPNGEEMQTRRDERFVERIYEQLIQGVSERERSLIARLVEADVDIADIAAAAIQMARAGEGALPVGDINEPVMERRSAERRSADRKGAYSGRKEYGGDAPRDGGRRNNGKAESRDRRPRQLESGMVRLRMNLGEAHGLRPGDVVGAIASEVGIPGRAIGEIDIRRDYTYVDVSEKHVRRILQASSGQYHLRGRPVLLTLVN
jgi:ATP-dependent RNA helicase DeaD